MKTLQIDVLTGVENKRRYEHIIGETWDKVNGENNFYSFMYGALVSELIQIEYMKK